MNLVNIKTSSKVSYIMLSVTRKEAIQIARTILDQIDNDSCNSGRIEFKTDKGYFSLSVDLDDKIQDLKIIQEKDKTIKKLFEKKHDNKNTTKMGNKISSTNSRRS